MRYQCSLLFLCLKKEQEKKMQTVDSAEATMTECCWKTLCSMHRYVRTNRQRWWREKKREKKKQKKREKPAALSETSLAPVQSSHYLVRAHTRAHRPGPAPRSPNMPGLMCCVLCKYAEWTARLHLVRTQQANNPRPTEKDSIGSCTHAASSRTCTRARCHAVSCQLTLGFYVTCTHTHTHAQHRDPLLSPIQPPNSGLFFFSFSLLDAGCRNVVL